MKKNALVRLGRSALGGLAVLVLLSACIKDQHTVPGPDPEDGIATVTFKVRVPGASNATTRGLSLQQEMKVDQMDILLFSADGNFAGRVTSEDIDQDGIDASLKTFTVDLPTGNWNIVMLANSKDVIDLVNPETGKGLKKDVLTEKLVKGLGVKWPVDGSALFPMWCDAGMVAITKGVDLTNKGWKLTRMVASVGVTVASGVDNFELASVHVYNYNNAGRLIPDGNKWDGSATYNGVNYGGNVGKVTGPTEAGTTVKGPLQGYTLEDGACMNEIYLFEYDNFTALSELKESDDRTCIVVGGYYNGSQTATYYRMDFSKMENGSEVYLNVLRNHKYIFNITDVRADGYTNPDDAFEAGISNIDVNVNDWNESELNLWIVGQYYFNVSPLYVEYLGQARPNCELVVMTNYDMGTDFYVVSTKEKLADHSGPGDEPDWITNVRLATLDPPVKNKYVILYDLDENDGNNERTAYIHIKTKTLEVTTTVRQMLDRITTVTLTPGGIIPAAGTDITIEAKVEDGGFFDSFVILAQDNHGEILGAGTIPSSSNGPIQSVVINVPEYWSTPSHTVPTQRRISFNYVGNMNAQWVAIGELTQNSYWINVACPGFSGGSGKIDEAGGSYEVQVWGEWSDKTIFRFWDETSRQTIGDEKDLGAGSAGAGNPEIFTLEVNQNPLGKDRVVRLEYSVDGGNRWYTVGEARTQDWSYLYVIDIASFDDIPMAGGRNQIQLSGNWPKLYVQVVDVDKNNAVIDEVEIEAAQGVDNSYSVLFDRNDSWNERQIAILVSEEDRESWRAYGTMGKQQGYTIYTPGAVSPTPLMEPKGGDVTVTVAGTFPASVGVVVRAKGNGIDISGITGSDNQIVMLIPNNDTGADRTITYTAHGITQDPSKAVYIGTQEQGKSNTVLHVDGYDVVVAHTSLLDEYGRAISMRWAQAMGIDEEFNSRKFGNPYYTPDKDTGCGIYKEIGFEGKWRLPSKNELEAIAPIRHSLGMNEGAGAYWSSEDIDHREVYALSCPTGLVTPHERNVTEYHEKVRCVRRK